MPDSPSPPWLDTVLRSVARRYRLPPLGATLLQNGSAGAAATLAMVIEHARESIACGRTPDGVTQNHFIDALAQLIRVAVDPNTGDPAFQAMVLRHRASHVREYVALSATASQDRRRIHAAVNAIAHPAKQDLTVPASEREALARLRACAMQDAWAELATVARDLFILPEMRQLSGLKDGLTRILDNPALDRLRRREALASDELVNRYQALWDRQGPRSGSATAATQGAASRRRGAAVETLAAQALRALAQRLNARDASGAAYRVVTSLRVPATLPGNADRAKSEWDVALLQRAASVAATWDIRLLAEAKASLDAATTDLPRLVRGLRLLAQAEEDAVYSFACREGTVELRGAALRALPTKADTLSGTVLYCSDASADAQPRLLNAAHRRQLLSAPASLEYADALMDGRPAQSDMLVAVWRLLLESPAWRTVLHQYPALRQIRELMVHTDDLLAAALHS